MPAFPAGMAKLESKNKTGGSFRCYL